MTTENARTERGEVIADTDTRGAVRRQVIDTNMDRPPLLSWSALAGGIVFVISFSWLLYLLGMSLGVSIADVTDGEAIGYGFTTGAVVWMIVSSLVVFFLGAMLTARLSGKLDSTVCILHGLTLWGVATTLMMVMSYWGVSALIHTGYTVASTTASAVTSAAPSVADAAGDAASAVDAGAVERVTDNVAARINRQAAKAIEKAASGDDENLSKEEIRRAIRELDKKAVKKAGWRLVNDDKEGAKDVLAANTNLSESQIESVVDGAEKEVAKTVEEYQKAANEAAEKASTYAQAVLWTSFVAGAMGLAVSLLGGWLGAETSRRLVLETQRETEIV